jgi:hypothetical protein
MKLERIGKQIPSHECNFDFLLSVRLQPCKFDSFRSFDTTEKIVPLDACLTYFDFTRIPQIRNSLEPRPLHVLSFNVNPDA